MEKESGEVKVEVEVKVKNSWSELETIWEGRSGSQWIKQIKMVNNVSEIRHDETIGLVITSPSDVGVQRNGGRRGSAFSPLAIKACLNKMIVHDEGPAPIDWLTIDQSEGEKIDFEWAQKKSAKVMMDAFPMGERKKILHLGGGHDHIYSFLKAIEEKENKPICVINIDAHADTRIDQLHHSGNPFRVFDLETKNDFMLIQIGLHAFSNDQSTLTKLKKGKMHIINVNKLPSTPLDFHGLEKVLPSIPENYCVVLSLDCDALSSSIMEGVSAVNPDGISGDFVKEIFRWYSQFMNQRNENNNVSKVNRINKKDTKNDKKNDKNTFSSYVGIYEYNPLYDNLSQKGAKYLASLIYQFFLFYCHKEIFHS
jgi:formiminoglutamase